MGKKRESNPTPTDATLKALSESHEPAKIRARLAHQKKPSYLKDFVYGAIDGAVTTFAVVSGVAGAGLSSNIVLVLGIANLVGDGFSMAAGNFLGTKAEQEEFEKLKSTERYEIDQFPEGEREEVREIYRRKGFEGDLLEQVVEVITANQKQWVDTMLQEEHGISLTPISAWRAAITTFISFLMIGLIPLLPFLIGLANPALLANPYLLSVMLTGVAFFMIGAAKSWFVDRHWLYSGLETLTVGGVAAALAFLCGVLLKGIGSPA